MTRVTPKCPYFSQCGGCQHQDVAYKQQLATKKQLLKELFSEQPVTMRGQEEPYFYRNRMDFVCTPQGIGLRGDSWEDVVDVKTCVISHPRINAALKTIRSWTEQHSIPCYDLQTHEGFLRYAVIRADDNALQVALTTNGARYEKEIALLADQLAADSVVWTLETTQSNQSVGDTIHRVFGSPTIALQLAGKEFLVDPYTFFQTSPRMAEQVIARMQEYVPQGALVHDLYCGVGVLGQCVSTNVVGVESVAASVEQARTNAAHNDVDAQYFCADAGAWLLGKNPQVVIVDPPRAGLGVGAQQLLAAKPERILYLSCNPKTQRRDVVSLQQAYKIVHVEGFDFFAHTDHVECLVVLKRR